MINKLKKLIKNQDTRAMFLVALAFYLFLGIVLSYNFDFLKNFNLLFDSDTSRVISDISEIFADHYRLNVHPLFVIIIQPIYFIVKGIFIDKIISIIIMSSVSSALTVTFIYKILNLFNKDKRINLLISLCYMTTFSNYIFTAGVELYTYATLFLTLMWYYIIKKFKNDKFDRYSYIILTLLGVLSASITITNFIVFLIIIFILFISKKVKIKKLIAITIVTVLITVILNCIQGVIWHNTPLFLSSLSNETSSYAAYSINATKIKNLISNDYYNSLIGSNLKLNITAGQEYINNNYLISFQNMSIFNIVIISIFYIMTLILVIRNYKKNLYINIGLTLAIAYNSILHILYGNSCAFLYSLHFVYLIFIILGINLVVEKNKRLKKYSCIYLLLFLVIEFIKNNIVFIELLKKVKEVLNATYLVNNIGFLPTAVLETLYVIFWIICLVAITYLIKKIKTSKSEKRLLLILSTVGIIVLVQCSCVYLNTIEGYNRILWKKLPGNYSTTKAKSKSYYLSEEVKEKYRSEINSLNEYINEYKEFLNEYENEKMEELNPIDYYLFGMGNRTKILYKKGKLIDLSTNKEIYKFNEKESLIIPNIYSVIIRDTNNNYIKIYENNDGIHYVYNDKDTIIEGTDVEINLYNFDNQKYQNIKKVLYGEILFNIKDSIIYPNILVYDKPWYRDAALASMVLKQTNNTDLITDWVESIDEIYDRQNANTKEPDNLGELLYIISTQENINYELVDKIKEEKDRICSENEKGYYLHGKTDFADEYLYQNLWYKLGIEQVGESFDINLDEIETDGYSKMAWWSNYKMASEPSKADLNYPYLSLAKRHNSHQGTIAVNKNIYPLSWEKVASQANYSKVDIIDSALADNKISPTHTWTASEMLLMLLDDTGNLN